MTSKLFADLAFGLPLIIFMNSLAIAGAIAVIKEAWRYKQ